MDERYSIYLDGKLEVANFYRGLIKGYIPDSMVEDKDTFQFEKSCVYFSYADILASSDVLSPLAQIYDEHTLDKAEVKINNRNHKKDLFAARGFWVYRENEEQVKEYIRRYEDVFPLFQGEYLESLNISDDVRIHYGDFVLFDIIERKVSEPDWEKYEFQRELAKNKAKVLRQQAQLSKAGAVMLMSPGERPISASNSAMIGGALAGTSGALYGAARGVEKQKVYNQNLQSYNNAKQSFLEDAAKKEREANYLENGEVNIPYKEVTCGEIFFGIRTFFGIIPLIKTYKGIEQNAICHTYLSEVSLRGDGPRLKEIESKELKDVRWLDIDNYFSTGKLLVNRQEAFNRIMTEAQRLLEDGWFDEVKEYCNLLNKVKPENCEIYLLQILADNGLNNFEMAREKKIKFSDCKYYDDLLRCVDSELLQRIEESDAGTEEDILREQEETREKKYEEACVLLKKYGDRSESLGKARSIFVELEEYRDAKEWVRECNSRIERMQKDEIYDNAVFLMNKGDMFSLGNAVEEFEKILGWKDAETKKNEVLEKIERLNKVTKWKSNLFIVCLILCVILGIILQFNIL